MNFDLNAWAERDRWGCRLRPPGSVPVRVDYNLISRPYIDSVIKEMQNPFNDVSYRTFEPPEELLRPKPPFDPCQQPKFQVKAGVFYNKCTCSRRNGLQDECPLSGCMGREECLTLPYPSCQPSGAWHLECL